MFLELWKYYRPIRSINENLPITFPLSFILDRYIQSKARLSIIKFNPQTSICPNMRLPRNLRYLQILTVVLKLVQRPGLTEGFRENEARHVQTKSLRINWQQFSDNIFDIYFFNENPCFCYLILMNIVPKNPILAWCTSCISNSASRNYVNHISKQTRLFEF